MNYLIALAVIATFVSLLVFSVKLRAWIRSMRRNICDIRDEVRVIARSNDNVITAISNMTAESVNAACINSLGFQFPVFMGGPSIDTHHVRNLLFLLQERKPRSILELGSGSSTVIISRALQLMGASPDVHISVDHEARFLRNTKELARLNGVDNLIQFEHCPLLPIEGFAKLWYSRIPELVNSVKLDFVVVDGPPAYAKGEGRTREPALTILRRYLAKNALIILDDANRPGELEVINAWLKEFPEFHLFHATEGKGIAILTLNSD